MKPLLKRLLPESLKARTRLWRGEGIAALASRTNLTRDPLARIFLRGEGIEVGALNWPLPLPRGARARHVDVAPAEVLAARFPEHAGSAFRVDHVAPVETLDGIADASQDFAVANHVLEHSEDPIRAFASLLRVLKPGGVLFFALPDGRVTFDRHRPNTPFEHLLRDYHEGPEWSRLDHYREFLRLVHGIEDDEEIERRAGEMAAARADLHFHVWDPFAMLEMIARLRGELGFPIELEAVSRTGIEAIFVLRKV